MTLHFGETIRKLSLTMTPALVMVCAGFAHSAETPHERLASFVSRMNSDVLADRDAAAVALQSDPGITLSMIEKALATDADKLSAEQIERLTQAGARLFSVQPRAAMGVSFSWNEKTADGVEISGTIEGFDSSRVLQAGDVIQTLDGEPLKDQVQSRAVIVSHSPGEEVTLHVIRQGEPLVVRLMLGNYADLDNRNRAMRAAQNLPSNLNNGLTSQTIRDAWELRRHRVLAKGGREDVPTIDAGLTDRNWAQIEAAMGGHEEARIVAKADKRRNRQQAMAQAMPPMLRQIPVKQVVQSDDDEPTTNTSVVAGGRDRSEITGGSQPFSLASYDTSERVQPDFAMALREIDNQMQINQARLQQPNLPDNLKASLKGELERLSLKRSMLLRRRGEMLGHVAP